MRVKKKKQKITYAILEVSSASNQEAEHYYLGKKSFRELQRSARTTLAIGVVCMVAAIAVIFLAAQGVFLKLQEKDKEIESLNARIEEITLEKDNLWIDLEEKIIKEQEAEAVIAMQYVPNNYPVTGVSSVYESSETVSLGEDNIVTRPIAVFTASSGATVIAAGSGVVLSVEEDANYGFKLTIDHGNGYISLYYNGGNPKVNKGDNVTKETVLFEITGFNVGVAFQIIEDGTYISPMSLVEIQG